MLQGQKALFIRGTAIQHAVVLLSQDDDVLLRYLDGEDHVSDWVPTESVYFTDADAVSAFIREHGTFPFNNPTPLLFEVDIEPSHVPVHEPVGV